MGEDSLNLTHCLAEFIGTYLLVFTVGCNVLTGSGVWAGVSIGCVLMVLIYALGGVSGGHFNPAVSLTLGFSNKAEWKTIGVYCGVQVAAGIAAGLSYSLLFGEVIALQPAVGFGWKEAMLAEFFYTFMLCFVVLNTAASSTNGVSNEDNHFYGLAIGFVVIAGAYGAGAISGGCFNPAVAFGLDISSAHLGVKWCFIYSVAEICGAALAAALFRVVRPEEFSTATEPAIGDTKLLARLTSEFLGTFMLVLTVGLNVLGKSPAPAFSIAASLMCMIYALGDVSGAHFNPAVTVAILASNHQGRAGISDKDGGAYIGAQLCGGMAASLMYTLMHHGETFPLNPGANYNYSQAAVAEIVFTFVLCFVVLSVATTRAPLKDTFGLAIGMCVTVGGFAIGSVSGGSLNPAVSFGISAAHMLNQGSFFNCLAYAAFELLGAGLAACVFKVAFPSEYPDSTPLTVASFTRKTLTPRDTAAPNAS